VGGSFIATVTASAGTCGWTAAAASASPWITLTSGASGTGSGETRYNVAPNVSTNARTGNLTVAGRTVTVTQAGMPSSSPVTTSGEISALSGSCPSLSFRAGGRNVRTNAETRFLGGSCGSYRNGREVTVVGIPQADGTLLAISVSREND